MADPRGPVGVVLLQLGGPDSLDAVEPFLRNLFSDPDIIDLPLAFLFRRPLARLISRRRAPKVQEYYRLIGNRSPLLNLTTRQATALFRQLSETVDVRVVTAMRYWHPMTDDAVLFLRKEGVRQVVLVPLYPQYSRSTTGSSVNEWNRVLAQRGIRDWDVRLVDTYCDHPLYVEAVVRQIQVALQRVPPRARSQVHLVFSAHGTPLSLVRAGDPYQEQVIRTTHAVIREGRFDLPHVLCYQSKVGPQKWLEPSLTETMHRLAAEGVSHVVVVPIAFVSDHSETLYEINIETRREAHARGISYFDIVPALNTNPWFIRCLAELVLDRIRP